MSKPADPRRQLPYRTVRPEEGLSLPKARLEGSPDQAEEGMAEMSKRFHDEGRELYVRAAD